MLKPAEKSTADKAKPWSVRDSKVNLAALLNDPRKAKRDYDLFTKTWGVEFRDLPPGSNIRRSKWIPNVQKGHFTEYLESTSDRVLRHASQSCKLLDDEDPTSKEFQSVYGTGHSQHTKAAIKTAITAQQQRDAVLKTRAALDAIPKIFLRSDFTLQNSHTFTSVLSFTETSADDESELKKSPREIKRQISSSKLLQEKLSHYLDMVEMAIIRQISLQSDAFFNAMSSHDKLHDQLNETLTKVQSLIKKMKSIESNIVSNPLKIVQLRRIQSNQASLLEKLHMMVTVHQTQPTIQLLLSTSEFAGSLDLINTTQEVLHQELSGIHCFRHLSSQLHEMENVIGHMMRGEVEEVLGAEVRRPLVQGHHCAEPHRLTAVVLGLLRQGQFDFLEGFRSDIETAVKTIIKDTVCDVIETSLSDDDKQSLASRMRSLSWDDWMLMLTKIFTNLILLLKRIKSILNIISSVARESLARGEVYATPQHLKSKKNKQKALKTLAKRGSLERNTFSDNNNSENENYDDRNNPFAEKKKILNGGRNVSRKNSEIDEKNPFFEANSPKKSLNPFENSVSPEKKSHPKSNGNPFADDYNEGCDLMEGLASYEDELINSAADLYDNSCQGNPDENEPQLNGNTALESSNENSEDQEIEEDNNMDRIPATEYEGLEKYLNALLGWTFDFQQDRCVKVLSAKGKDGSLDKLSSGDFLLLAKSIKRYTSQAEVIVRRKSETETLNSPDHAPQPNSPILNGALRGALLTQAGRFVSRFHEERRTKLSLILDNENWKQAEVPAELTTLLQDLVDGKLNHSTEQPSTNGHSNHESKPPTAACATELLVLNGERFAVVGTVLILLKMVSEYCKCSDDLPASTADLVHRLHDLLTLFNSRTCQLVLGAGALQLVGLKTITTKNLALASRCLQLVLHCLPSIRSHFETKVLTYNQHNRDGDHNVTNVPHKHKAVLRHFDHVTKDYQDHVDEIENKFNVIVGGVVERYLSKWEVKAPVPSPSFRHICKQITKFHETVSSLLPQKQTHRIILSVNSEFKRRLRDLLVRFGVTNNGGPQHGLVSSDLGFYDANIKNLSGLASIDLKLHTVWS